MDIINHEFDAQTTPVYFSLALKRSYDIYMVYFLLFAICMACFDRPRSILPVAVWLAATFLARHYMSHIFIRWNFLELRRNQFYSAADADFHVFSV